MTVNINPAMFHIGPFEIRWYGFMYVLGLVIALIYLSKRYKMKDFIEAVNPPVDFEWEVILWVAIGILIGARLFFVLLYDPVSIFTPDEGKKGLAAIINVLYNIINIRTGGLSFHGGLVGVLIATAILIRYRYLNFYRVADASVVIAPLGLFFGRLGNFINGELWGRPTNLPWGMIFPNSGQQITRHPSQLYEALFEGLILFLILFFLEKANRKSKKLKTGFIFWLFIFGYGFFRFFIEYTREPDKYAGWLIKNGFVLGGLTMGQILCLIMVLISAPMLYLAQTQDYFEKRFNLFILKNKEKIEEKKERERQLSKIEEEKRKEKEKEKIKKLVEQQKTNKKKKKRSW
ncbi:MAG: prolipoprotein diacylglyceryl transferase [Exilispira sp.]